ncbi:hypothetical protein M472_06110 [Sphingobacterium paucimobilis HER1398]|uniref:FecR protein domain-containing protein n=2 Tax=Sphingobacterium TaxID=28453 RepID=U2HS53_9SPHI|nr:hypothetical protein M472_06110 [Sphingobacterium paucimobilis HER1398]
MVVNYIDPNVYPYVMTREEYILLYERYLDGKCSVEELETLENYKDDFSIDTISYWHAEKMGNEEVFKKNSLVKIRQQININKAKVIRFSWKKYAVACVALLVLFSISVRLYQTGRDTEVERTIVTTKRLERKNVLAPLLTLSDGEQISLSDSTIGSIYTEGGELITRQAHKELVYTEMSDEVGAMRYNTLSVPQGMSYKVVLSDGSIVWLNAGSVLKYPVVFASSERKVELSGEAYFDVERNELKPFRVIVNESEVEVLGTAFNVNGYDKDITRTTLVEGSVKLKGVRSKVILKPGQMGIDTKSSTIELKKVNVESVIDWKNGLFTFDDENLESILEKVSRWYGVEVEYVGKVSSDYLYYGRLERTVAIEEILKSIELTGKTKFEIITDKASGKERRIIVTTK